MTYHLEAFANTGLSPALLRLLMAEHERCTRPRLERLWSYYRNQDRGSFPRFSDSRRPAARLAQSCGLPPRFIKRDVSADDRRPAPEIVIENDIAWRIQAMVDFMFGKPVSILSTAADERTRRQVERVLDAVWEASGGIALLQDLALLGHVYGHADLRLSVDEDAASRALRKLPAPGRGPIPAPGTPGATPPTPAASDDLIAAATQLLRIDLIEPTRGIPVLNSGDYREIAAYIIHCSHDLNAVDTGLRSVASRLLGAEPSRRRATRTEIISANATHVYEDGRLVLATDNPWTPGQIPIVHIQNISEPFQYAGLSEVEPLIPLQDELNTRLSDRAARVTMQSFKMYLAKGIDGFEKLPIGPGQIISTDNPDATVEAFGGDGASPSEDKHIQEIREALDKTSGIPPLASGVVRARIGNLSSANALRITLMGVLSKTARKRVTYGGGIARMCRLILTALDSAGILKTNESDRGVKLHWPDPLPEDLHDSTLAAKAKADLGVPRERILADLGYTGADPGVE
jgi:hypothetical protein